jgi:WD40 repeat protein
LDLGLARLHHDPGDDPSALTQMGIVVGTPDYMSPEQARNASRADIRSDLYSLGCTFYFLLTGQVPFAGATATEKLIKHCFEPPPPLEKLRPDIPPRVCKVVEKLMAKQPEERYPTPAKLVVALSRPGLLSRPLTRPLTKFLRGMLGQDPPLRPDAPERLRKAAQRRRWLRLNILGGLALAVLLLLFGILLWTSGSSTPTGKASLPSPRSTRLAADLLDPKGIPPEERFAWQPNELVAVLGKHRARTWGQVHVLTISADSQMLACGASDGSVHLFDATTLVEQAVIREENYGSIWAIAFAPDGKTLAFAGFDGNIYLWEPSRPKPVRKGVLKGHRNTVIALAFSPDSQTLASGSSDATLRLWDLGRPDRPEFANVKADESAVHAIAFGPDGKTLVTGGRDRKVRLWDLAGGKLTERWAVAGHQDTISTVAFVARGDRVVSSSHGRYIRVWDAADGKQVSFTDVSRGNNPTGVFSPDGHLFAAGAGGSPTRIWDLAGGEPRDRLNLGPQSQGSYVMAFAPNNKALVTAGFHRLNLWDLSGGKPRLALSSRDDAVDVRSVALASDGRTLATGGYNGRLRLWDLAATEPVERSAHEPHNRTIGAVEFSPDGKLLVSAGQDSTLRVWDVSGSRFVEVGKFTDFNNSVTSAAFAGDGKLLAGGSQDRTVRLYDVAAGKVTLRGELTHSDPVNAVALDANGHTLVCLVGDQLRGHTLRLWDLTPARPRVRADLRPPRGFWTKMALSPDGRTLAAGTGNGALRLWDLGAADPRDRREWPIPGARGAVSALALSPDGQLLAASVPGRLVVWDLGAMKMIRDWELPGTVEDLAFGPEGRHLITANANGTVYILRLSSPR